MSYKYTKGSTVQGDIKAADDTERNTIIDFGEDQIEFQTSGSTRLKVDNNGVKVSGVNLGVGTGQGGSSDGGGNPVYTNGEANPKYTIHAIGDINNGAVFATETYADSVGASKFRFIKARGTPGSPAGVNTDDEIGRLEFYSHIGSDAFKLSAMILGTADSDGDGKLSFRATHGGSDNEAFYIHNNLARFNDQIVLGSSGMVPYANKGASLGGASSQWNQVNAATVKAFETLFVGATNQIFDQSGLGIGINDDYEPHGNNSDMEGLIINTKYTSSSNLVLGLVKTGSHTVGIGTAGTGNSNEKLVFFGEYNTTSFEFRNNVGTAPLGLQTSGSVLMTLSAAGNLGIGSASPISKLDVAGKIAITAESATPSQPSDGQGYLYTKSDGKLYWRSYDVTETDLTSGGGGSPAGSNTQVQYNNNGSFAGNARMTFDSDDGALAVSGSVQVIGEEYIVPKELTTDADRRMCFTLKRQFHFSNSAANTWHDVISWRPYVAGGSSDPGDNTFWGAVSFKQEMSGHQSGVGNGYRSRVGMVQYEGSSASAASATDTNFGSPVTFRVNRSGWVTTLQFNPNSGGSLGFIGMCYVEIHFARGAGGNGANIYWSIT